MKKINELLALVVLLATQRGEVVKEMELTLDLVGKESRGFTDTEQTLHDANKLKVAGIDEKINSHRDRIEILERQEELNKKLVVPKNPPKTEEEKASKRFDLFKGMREMIRGNLSGLELEMTQEGEKEMKEAGAMPQIGSFIIPSSMIRIGTRAEFRAGAEIGTGDTTPPIKTGAVDLLSIVRTPIVIDTIGGSGVTKYEGLTGNLKVPKMGQLVATQVAEKSAVTTGGPDLISDTLAPLRWGATDFFTTELLNQTSPAIQAQILREYVDAIWRALQVKLFDEVAAGATVITGSEITDTPAALTHALILSMESTIESGFPNMAYAMSNGQKALLKALVLDSGSGKFAWMDNMVNDYSAVATDALKATNGGTTNTAFDVIFGNWKSAVVGSWGGIEMIVDPYTAAPSGEIAITGSGLFDTGVANALSFSAIRNATI